MVAGVRMEAAAHTVSSWVLLVDVHFVVDFQVDRAEEVTAAAAVAVAVVTVAVVVVRPTIDRTFVGQLVCPGFFLG